MDADCCDHCDLPDPASWERDLSPRALGRACDQHGHVRGRGRRGPRGRIGGAAGRCPRFSRRCGESQHHGRYGTAPGRMSALGANRSRRTGGNDEQAHTKEHWFRPSQYQDRMVCNMGASLYEPLNVYKLVASSGALVNAGYTAYRSHQPIGLIRPSTTSQAPAPIMPPRPIMPPPIIPRPIIPERPPPPVR